MSFERLGIAVLAAPAVRLAHGGQLSGAVDPNTDTALGSYVAPPMLHYIVAGIVSGVAAGLVLATLNIKPKT